MQQAIAESLSGAKLWKISRSVSEDGFFEIFQMAQGLQQMQTWARHVTLV